MRCFDTETYILLCGCMGCVREMQEEGSVKPVTTGALQLSSRRGWVDYSAKKADNWYDT